jgi:hypothetical protein
MGHHDAFINDEGTRHCLLKLCSCIEWKVIHLFSGLPNKQGYGSLRTDSAGHIPTWQRELPVPIFKREICYRSPSHTNQHNYLKLTSAIMPRAPTDQTSGMRKTLDSDWPADLAFDQSERAELLRHLPQCEDANDRSIGVPHCPAHCLSLAAKAVAIIRACLPRPPRTFCVAGGSKPRSTGNATGTAVEAAANASEIDSLPVEEIASIGSIARAPGLESPPRASDSAKASLLTKAARRAASLLPVAIRRAASRFLNGSPAAAQQSSTPTIRPTDPMSPRARAEAAP